MSATSNTQGGDVKDDEGVLGELLHAIDDARSSASEGSERSTEPSVVPLTTGTPSTAPQPTHKSAPQAPVMYSRQATAYPAAHIPAQSFQAMAPQQQQQQYVQAYMAMQQPNGQTAYQQVLIPYSQYIQMQQQQQQQQQLQMQQQQQQQLQMQQQQQQQLQLQQQQQMLAMQYAQAAPHQVAYQPQMFQYQQPQGVAMMPTAAYAQGYPQGAQPFYSAARWR